MTLQLRNILDLKFHYLRYITSGERHGHVRRDAGGGGAVPAVLAGPDRPDRPVQEGGVRSDSTEPGQLQS